ncbi:acyltransferase family protein [Streptococcus sp. E29BA]|uniref:acyltransferase family protein n=1 Tax=Streptococcus sp. E29BA TaxID=3278716 RepID=UPI00359EA4B5
MSDKPKAVYPLLSFFQYLFAIGVLVVHSGSLFEQPLYHFIAKSIFARQAVPFFLISSAYFLRKKAINSPRAETVYYRKLLKTYVIWSMVYLPYAFFYFQQLGLPIYLLPIGLLVGLLYVGVCYQLWYIPALLQGLFLVKAGRRYLPGWLLFSLILLLYLFGSIETYTGYLEGTVFETIYRSYAQVFLTSRNGLFFAPLFLYLGQVLADKEDHPIFAGNRGWKVLISLVLFLAEASLIFTRQGLDKNFFLTLPIFSLSLFNWCLHYPTAVPWSGRSLKDLSMIIYFVHPIFIELSLFAFRQYELSSWKQGRLAFTSALIGSHIIALLFLKLKRTKKNI